MITPSPSTPHCASGQSHQPGCMVQCAMPPQTSYISKALGPYPAGLMTTSSFKFDVFFSRTTTRGAGHGIRTSSPGVNIRKAGGSGLEVGYLRMVHSRSLTKTAPFHARTYLGHQRGQQRTCYMHTTLMTSMSCHKNWASHGKYRKIDHSQVLQPTSALIGTLRHSSFLGRREERKIP